MSRQRHDNHSNDVLDSRGRVLSRSALLAVLEDNYIGHIAATSMLASVLLFFVQILIFIPATLISEIAPAMGWIEPRDGETIATATTILIEIASVLAAIVFIRRQMPKHPAQLTESELHYIVEEGVGTPFTERRLEMAILSTAVIASLYACGIGLNVFAVKIALFVIECFAAIFMTIFVVTRWALTRETRPFGLAGLIVTFFSLWLLTRELGWMSGGSSI